ncbi:hypothetical protein CEXT_473071 [Caerostris extrusa]|uniref:Uncharacterized protein n=1 Tax=Caerostris extrusa TaxID=172846 RepID=A0AAV4NK60_CAEEX|nr:hypothetical protein CEXT_473071 [Caerostris extrusa]
MLIEQVTLQKSDRPEISCDSETDRVALTFSIAQITIEQRNERETPLKPISMGGVLEIQNISFMVPLANASLLSLDRDTLMTDLQQIAYYPRSKIILMTCKTLDKCCTTLTFETSGGGRVASEVFSIANFLLLNRLDPR